VASVVTISQQKVNELLVSTVTTLLLIVVLFVATMGQDEARPVGSIDFFGYAGLNLDQIKASIPIHVGDRFPGPLETVEGINKAVTSVIGRPPTDIASVCCDAQGNYMIYVGLPGASSKQPKLNLVPKGTTRFPQQVIDLYEQTMDASSAAVLRGNARDDNSKGYALSSTDQALRDKQLAIRAYAIQHEKLIRAVLDSSSEARQRIVAAHFLGYARQSNQQITSLLRGSYDADETVRNNATRALGVLAESSPKVAARIPAGRFIEMLSSGTWSDRNKAVWVLNSLTRTRDPKLLAQLRSEALVSLIEMARWKSVGHASTARLLLARIAGVDDERATQLANMEDGEQVIKALNLKP
jgi:hypothetical protein